MNNSDSRSHLLMKVKQTVSSLQEETEDVKKDMNNISHSITMALESVIKSFKSCDDAEALRGKFKELSQEFDEIDEQLTIIRATISSTTYWTVECEDAVEDVVMDKSMQSSRSRNYLEEKLLRKLASVEEEGNCVQKILRKLKYKVEELLEAAKAAGEKLWSCEEENMMKTFKEVSKELGVLDMQLTMLRSALSSCLELFGDNMVEEEVDKIVEVKQIKSQVNESDITSETIRQKLQLSCDHFVQVNDDSDTLEHLLDATVSDVEVERVLAMKLEENRKLLTICQASDKHRQVVKDRVKENLLRGYETISSGSRVSGGINISMPNPVAQKLSVSMKSGDPKVSMKSGDPKPQPSTPSNSGYAASTSSIVETHRRHQLEQLRKKFGEYGEPVRVGEYKEFKMIFDSGCPAMFWLYVDTAALYDLQALIQKKVKGKPHGDGGGSDLEVGSMVLARYPVDKALYRARVEEMLAGEEDLFSVRYIDYGNRSDCLTRGDLYTWDTMLARIPPQAVSCSFYGAPEHIREMTSLTMEEMEVFTSLMKQSSPMQMKVHQCLTNEDMFRHQTGPDLAVTLRSKDGRDILTKLSLLPNFREFFIQHQVSRLPVSSSVSAVAAPPIQIPVHLSQASVHQLDHLNPPVSLRPVPPPLHLDGEELAQVCTEEPTSPLHPTFTSRAVEKVQWWLDREEHGDQQLREDFDRRREQNKNPVFQEPDFVQTEKGKKKASLLSQARKQMCQDDLSNSTLSENSPRTSRPKKVTKTFPPVASLQSAQDKNQPIKKDPIAVFPSVDVRAEQTPPPPSYTPPTLDIQEVELDANGEFQFMVSVIISPEEFYVHPVQESSGSLAQLERELDMTLKGEQVAMELEVAVGSIWAVHQKAWYRVEVISVSYGNVSLRSIDYGHVLLDVDVSQLNHLPPGLATKLPGLAVRCHLAMVKPVQEETWGKLAIQVLTGCLEGKELHTALFVERKDRSVGVVVMMEQQGKFSTANKRLVEVGCAVSSVFGDHTGVDDLEDSGLVNDWDPMADDFNSNTNNYMTNDDDLGIATDGYKSKDKVCAFYLNRGRCYKGAYCEDKHIMPREGAVTADQEEVIIGTADLLEMPVVSTTVLVKVTWVMSPSAFYITFPHGTRDISNIQQLDTNKRHPTMFSNMMDSMQMCYQGNCRKLFMDSLPASGSLLVTRSKRDKLWHRAMARDSSEGEVEVFFVDLGQVEVVTPSNTRKLESCFSVLPFQASLACLASVEPVGQGWCKEATTLFKKLTTTSQYLTAKVMTSSPNQPLVVELSTRLQLQDKPHLNMAMLLKEKGWAKMVEVNEDNKVFSVHIPG